MDGVKSVNNTGAITPGQTPVVTFRTPSQTVRYRRVDAAIVGSGTSAVVPAGAVGTSLPSGSMRVTDPDSFDVMRG
jgi:hypothetical protein